jgi:hypothetical protein
MKPFLKSGLSFFVIVFAIIFVLAMSSADAKKKSGDIFVKSGTLIKSVNLSASTVEVETVKSHTTHTYKIDGVTVIIVRGVPGKITDLKFGLQVEDLVERDDVTLDSITVNTADKFKKK